MANKKISELTTRTPSLTDLILVGDPTSGYSYKCTVSALATIIETDIADAYVTLDTAQTISGAKTFSNNLTLTSVTNAATTQTKFLTLNGSNVVNYRTGSQVLADIGASDDTLVVHKAGDETITGIKTFSARGKFDAGINLKQGSGASLDTGYSAISADATTFYFHRSTSIAALSVNNLTTTRTYTLQDANGTLAFLSDIPSLTGYVPTSRTLTINGTSYDLSANRTWSVGTVTSVGLSTGTTGTDISVSGSPVTSSGTITLNIPTASATNRGALSSTDWTTFNNKQNAITLTTTGTSGAATLVGSTLNIPQYQSVLTNPVTGTGTTNYIPKFTSSSAIGNSQIFDNGTNVGIGTASPGAKLEVANGFAFLSQAYAWSIYNTTGTAWAARIGAAGDVNLNTTGNNAVIAANGANSILFGTNSSERMRLDASGNLGIGTSSPTAKLTVSGTTSDQIRVYEVTDATNYYRIGRNSTTGFLDFYGNQSGYVGYVWGGINGTRMTLDASGNLGLGVTPSAWGSGGKAIQVGTAGAIAGIGSDVHVSDGMYYDGTNWRFLQTGVGVSTYYQTGGSHIWYSSGSGTAGNTVSLTQAMTLDASGQLLIGLTSNTGGGRIEVQSNATSAITTRSSSSGVGQTVKSIRAVNSAADQFANSQYDALSHAWILSNSTQAMTLFSTGNLAVGGTSDNGSRLNVTGAATFSSSVTANAASTINGAYPQLILNNPSAGAGIELHFKDNGTLKSKIGTLDDINSWQVYNGGAIRFTINNSGNVGIGTTSPAYKLQVGDLANTSGVVNDIFITGDRVNTNNYYARLIFGNSSQSGGSTASIRGERMDGSNFATGLTFYTNGTGSAGDGSERMRITSGGNVGIGTTSPSQKLSVFGGNLLVNNGVSPDANSGIRIVAPISTTQYNWMIAAQQNINSGFEITPSTAVGGTTFSTPALSVLASGNVGIGTTSPTANTVLDVSTSGTRGYIITQSTSATAGSEAGLRVKTNTKDYYIFSDNTSDALRFYDGTALAERMRITSGGNVGIGTSSPDVLLHIKGTPETATVLRFSPTSSSTIYSQVVGINGDLVLSADPANAEGSTSIKFNIDNSEKMRLNAAGELLINTTSDAGDYKLQVNGNSYISGILQINGGGTFTTTSYGLSLYGQGYEYKIGFDSQGGTKGYIRHNIVNGGANDTWGHIFSTSASGTPNTFTNLMFVGASGNVEIPNGSIKTAAPSGGTAKPIKFGEIVTLGGSNTQGVRVEIDGTVYYLVTGYLP